MFPGGPLRRFQKRSTLKTVEKRASHFVRNVRQFGAGDEGTDGRYELACRCNLTAAIPNGFVFAYYRGNFDPKHGKIREHQLDIEDDQIVVPKPPGGSQRGLLRAVPDWQIGSSDLVGG